MMLYLMRHAEALSTAEAHVGADTLRSLSPHGMAIAARVGRVLHAAGVRPDRILVSPLLRARQTAERVAAELACADRVEICQALEPESSVERFLGALREGATRAVVLAVGHQPLLGEIAGQLAGGAIREAIRFRPAGVVWVELSDFPRSWKAVVRARWDPDGIGLPGR